MDTAVLPGWQCVCGWFNKPGWVVCPGCERHQADVVAGVYRPRQPAPPVPHQIGRPHQVGMPHPPDPVWAAGQPLAPRRRGRAGRTILAVLVAICAVIGAGVAVRLADIDLLHPGTGRALAVVKRLNGRSAPPASEAAAYAALGRRLTPPDEPYRNWSGFRAGGVTPDAFAAAADSKLHVTAAAVRATGIQRAWATAWSTRREERVVVTWLYEFADSNGMPLRASSQMSGMTGAVKFATTSVAMHTPGVSAVASKSRVNGMYVIIAAGYRGNRLATISFMSRKRPDSKEIDWFRTFVRNQQNAL